MKIGLTLILSIILYVRCTNSNGDIEKTEFPRTELVCTETGCRGTYIGPEFLNGTDIAHQFSNRMALEVGLKLKELYDNGNFVKVDLEEITMSTKGMGSGEVEYELSVPFIQVMNKCDARTSFDHVGGWNHEPELKERKKQLSSLLLKGQTLELSSLKTTPEGLQEYWIQWRNKQTQYECE